MSSFSSSSTTDDVLEGIDLSGRRVLITGAATGLGRESARAMAAHGAAVTLLVRDEARATDAAREIEALVPGAQVEPGVVDLADLSSIRRFTEQFMATHDVVDVLINNAGVMACPFSQTADGFEMQFGTNHLGHFVLTASLAPVLLNSATPRVVTLSSAGHSRSDVDLGDPNFEKGDYDPWIAYGRSKTANALFARELARRGAGRGFTSFSVHPGGIITDLGRHLTEELIADMSAFAKARAAASASSDDDAPAEIIWKSVESGAATQVYAATTRELAGHNGAYLADCGLGVLGANPGANGYLPYLEDDGNAERLWERSEELTGTSFEL